MICAVVSVCGLQVMPFAYLVHPSTAAIEAPGLEKDKYYCLHEGNPAIKLGRKSAYPSPCHTETIGDLRCSRGQVALRYVEGSLLVTRVCHCCEDRVLLMSHRLT